VSTATEQSYTLEELVGSGGIHHFVLKRDFPVALCGVKILHPYEECLPGPPPENACARCEQMWRWIWGPSA